MLQFLKRTAASVTNAATGKVKLFFDSADGLPKIKDETGTVSIVGGVYSFNGRSGAVTPQQADYDAFFTTPSEASAAAPVQMVFGRNGNVVAQFSDYSSFYQKLYFVDATTIGISTTNTAAQNTTAFNNWYATAPVNYTLQFPDGTFDFSGELTLNRNLQGMHRGMGKSRTILRTTSATANLFYISISAYYYSWEELGFTSTVTKTAGAMIGTNPAAGDNAYLDIRRCEFKNYFVGIALDGVGAANVGTLSEILMNTPSGSSSIGLRINGENINFMVTNVTINHNPGSAGLGTCLQILTSGACQFMGCDFIGGQKTLEVNPTVRPVSALYFANCFFDQAGTVGVDFIGTQATSRVKFVQCGITNGNVANSIALRVAGTGTGTAIPEALDFVQCDFYNSFAGLSSTGALLTGVRGISLTNCRVSGFTVGIDVTPYNSAGVTNIDISGCTIGPTENFPGNGIGIRLNAGAVTYAACVIENNDLSGNTTPLVNNGTFQKPLLIGQNIGLASQPQPSVANQTVNAVETIIHQVALDANALLVGTTIKFYASGTITGTTPSLLPRIRIGTAGTTADAQVCATVAAVMTTATGWQVEGFLTVRSIGAAGTVIGQVRTLGEALATANRVSAQTATVAANTTVPLFVSLSVIGGGTTPVVTVVQANAEIVRQ